MIDHTKGRPSQLWQTIKTQMLKTCHFINMAKIITMIAVPKEVAAQVQVPSALIVAPSPCAALAADA